MTTNSQKLLDFLEIYWTDVYKTGHKFMLPPGSWTMYSNMTPRSGKLANFPNSKGVISAGQQKTVRQMKWDWDANFFNRPVEEIYQFGKDMTEMLMLSEPYDVSHLIALHSLGYLPLRIKAIPEGMFVPYKVPLYTAVNTHPTGKAGFIFDWLVNYLETIWSAESWQTPTSATTAYEYRKLGLEYAKETDPENLWFVDYQFHDFSMRGMGGKSSIINSGLGFAMCSRGSDTLPVIPAARKYYDEPGMPINSVLATEHAIMCTLTGFFLKKNDGSWENIGKLEVETFRYLLKRFPSGILSLVSDTWNLWRVILDYCRQLREEILARDGKLVIRPDSGDPVDIICGLQYETSMWSAYHNNKLYFDGKACWRVTDTGYDEVKGDYTGYKVTDMVSDNIGEIKGVIECLYEIFGGTMSATGYKKLDSHIGAIYGDSITLDRAKRIFIRLKAKGFASTNIVLGVGSYSLQYVTRDTHGFAQKATYVEINFVDEHGNAHLECIDIFKDPETDKEKTKKSARGLIYVGQNEDGSLFIEDQVSWAKEATGILQVIFEDGEFYNQTTLTEIRKRIGLVS